MASSEGPSDSLALNSEVGPTELRSVPLPPAKRPRRAIGARRALERAANGQTKGKAVPDSEPPVEISEGPEAVRLMARANVLLGQGNIGAARIVLGRAAETGSAHATFRLAETFDPLVLSSWRTYGTRGDVTKARALYAKAFDGGIKIAKDRSNALLPGAEGDSAKAKQSSEQGSRR